MDENPTSSVSCEMSFVIKPVPGKGLGWIATTKIPAGTRILAESPLFLVPCGYPSESTLIRVVKGLSLDQQRDFLSMHNAFAQKGVLPFHGILITNMFRLGPTGEEKFANGVFSAASRINHCCRANTETSWKPGFNKLTIHACKDIEVGEEITRSYFDRDEAPSYKDRQETLKSKSDFSCLCELCKSCEKSSLYRQETDLRRQRITGIQTWLEQRLNGSSPRFQGAYHFMRRILDSLKEEGIMDARVPQYYWLALLIAVSEKDKARAKVFRKWSYDARVLVEGADSMDALMVKGLLGGVPYNHWKHPAERIPAEKSRKEFEDWLWMESSNLGMLQVAPDTNQSSSGALEAPRASEAESETLTDTSGGSSTSEPPAPES